MHLVHHEVFVQLSIETGKIGSALGIHSRYFIDWAILGKRFGMIKRSVGAASRVSKARRQLPPAAETLQSCEIHDPGKIIVAWPADTVESSEHGSRVSYRAPHHKSCADACNVRNLNPRSLTA